MQDNGTSPNQLSPENVPSVPGFCQIAKALIGEWVHLKRVGPRALVYYCRILIRELDLERRSSIWCSAGVPTRKMTPSRPVHNFSRRLSQRGECKGCPGTFGKACHETRHKKRERMGTHVKKGGPPCGMGS